jgi:integrase
MKADYDNRGQDLRTLEKRWKHLEPVFGTDLVATISSGRMQAYVVARREEGAAKATVQHEIAALRRMFRLGFKASPRKIAFVPAVPEIDVDNARKIAFTDEEFRRLHEKLLEATAATPNDWLPLFAMLKYWLPTRTEDLLSREWSRHVDIDTGRIEFDPVKRGRARKPFLPAEALTALRAWHDKTRRFEREHGVIVRHVFHRHGEAVRSFPYQIWHEACRAADINGRRIPHDLRRTATRNYRRSGVDEGTVMAIAGWRTRAMFDRYDIKDDDDLKSAAERIATAKWATVGKKRRVIALKKAR